MNFARDSTEPIILEFSQLDYMSNKSYCYLIAGRYYDGSSSTIVSQTEILEIDLSNIQDSDMLNYSTNGKQSDMTDDGLSGINLRWLENQTEVNVSDYYFSVESGMWHQNLTYTKTMILIGGYSYEQGSNTNKIRYGVVDFTLIIDAPTSEPTDEPTINPTFVNEFTNIPPAIEWITNYSNIEYPVATSRTCFEIYKNTLFGFGHQGTGDKNVYWIDLDYLIQNLSGSELNISLWNKYTWDKDTSVGLDWSHTEWTFCIPSTHSIDNLVYWAPPDSNDQTTNSKMLIFDMELKQPVPASSYDYTMPCCSIMGQPCTVGNDTHIFVMGGYGGGNDYWRYTQIYSIEHDTWEYGASIRNDRVGANCFYDKRSDLIWLYGGWNFDGGTTDSLTSIEYYDTHTNVWTVLGDSFTYDRADGGMINLMIDGVYNGFMDQYSYIYAVSGFTEANDVNGYCDETEILRIDYDDPSNSVVLDYTSFGQFSNLPSATIGGMYGFHLKWLPDEYNPDPSIQYYVVNQTRMKEITFYKTMISLGGYSSVSNGPIKTIMFGIINYTQTLIDISDPTNFPTFQPSAQPSVPPTVNPTTSPTLAPSAMPTIAPTKTPSNEPTVIPTANPSVAPTNAPSNTPTNAPSNAPTYAPTTLPSTTPTGQPSISPSSQPTNAPSTIPTHSSDENNSYTWGDITLSVVVAILGILVICLAAIVVFMIFQKKQRDKEIEHAKSINNVSSIQQLKLQREQKLKSTKNKKDIHGGSELELNLKNVKSISTSNDGLGLNSGQIDIEEEIADAFIDDLYVNSKSPSTHDINDMSDVVINATHTHTHTNGGNNVEVVLEGESEGRNLDNYDDNDTHNDDFDTWKQWDENKVEKWIIRGFTDNGLKDHVIEEFVNQFKQQHITGIALSDLKTNSSELTQFKNGFEIQSFGVWSVLRKMIKDLPDN